MTHKLINEKTGEQVKPGDTVTDFRGTKWTLLSFQVLQPPSTGRVVVQSVDYESAFYPSVFGLKIVEAT